MGDISIICKVSLSKKLRSLLGKNGSIILTTDELVNGVGNGKLNIYSEENQNIDIKVQDIAETSIMLTAIEIADVPDEEIPPQSTIFNTFLKTNEEYKPIKKIAITKPPEQDEIPNIVKENSKTPVQFKAIDNPDAQQWIKNAEELFKAVAIAIKTKKSNIDPTAASSARERAVMLEQKEREEAIDIPAWVVNRKCGMLTINDLDISLPLNSPYNLGNISARRLYASKDFKHLLKEGYIELISPAEKDRIIMETMAKNENDKSHGLEIFDNHEDAIDSITDYTTKAPIIKDEEAIEVTDELTEEEKMIINLTQNRPITRKNDNSNQMQSAKVTKHNNTIPNSNSPKPIITRKF